MAMAAAVTVLEVDRLVEPGEIDPDDVHLPGLFVKRIVHVPEHRNAIEFRTTSMGTLGGSPTPPRRPP
jgi:3-oxoacid CoA-transferase subunit A